MIVYMLTTLDNPFDPFTQYKEWHAFDTQHGYNTASYLARIVRTSDELSDPDQQLAIQQAIDEIVRLNVRGVYVKIDAEEGKKLRENPKHMLKHSEDRMIHVSEAIGEYIDTELAKKVFKEYLGEKE